MGGGDNVPKIKYLDLPIERNPEHLQIVKQANTIIAEYQRQGFILTLRQLYYQFVSRDLIKNTMQEYKRLGGIINDGRLAGMIDWSALEDRTRNLERLSTWAGPADIVESTSEQFRVDKWATQPHRVEVWIEKEALAGIIEDVCNEYQVPFLACKGYTSQSEMWSAGQRLLKYRKGKQPPVILHFGDHDPSGIDMTRDIQDRLKLFMGGLEIRRLALNMDQIEQYEPPPNPAKLTDSRIGAYLRDYGNESWELDALEPAVLVNLIRDEIEKLIEPDDWAERDQEETEGRADLARIAARFDDVKEYLGGNE